MLCEFQQWILPPINTFAIRIQQPIAVILILYVLQIHLYAIRRRRKEITEFTSEIAHFQYICRERNKFSAHIHLGLCTIDIHTSADKNRYDSPMEIYIYNFE